MLGGGEQYWYKRGTKGMIPDDLPDDRNRSKTNMVAEAQGLGYQYAYDAQAGLATGPKALGLIQQSPFVRESLADDDRGGDPHYVPEETVVAKAIELLSQNPNGFFLAIEVDQIDEAGHGSHAGLVIKTADILNRIVRTVEAYRAADLNLLFVVTADHETGGLTLEGPNSNSTEVRGFPVPPRWRNGPFGVEGTEGVFTTDWTTPGHTGVPVPLTAAGYGSAQLAGLNDNTEVFDVARVLTGTRRRPSPGLRSPRERLGRGPTDGSSPERLSGATVMGRVRSVAPRPDRGRYGRDEGSLCLRLSVTFAACIGAG